MTQELAIFLLRIGLLALLYLFLAQVVVLVLRDLRASGKPDAPDTTQDTLTVLDGQIAGLSAGDIIPLEKSNTLGRAPVNTVRLVDDFVSAQHAVLDYRQRTWLIEDKGSTNGTFVNGRPVNKPTKVKDGDVIQIGTSKLRLGKR